jgi:lipopolysaccharide transport system ATP-binding protein
MSATVIRASGLSKSYRLGARERQPSTFGEAMTSLVKSPFRRIRSLAEGGDSGELFWALENVSFEVERGEVVGVIGRNGAGKSTLLKILSRITEPTAGEVRINGRVASLLEVGTGFHPELTGRENIFLNGAILGMKRTEIQRKFDEIVAFADIERFLDTPVKRYSSGMYVRLAFAVAAHLEPEILIVDEVLAVGDHQFQKKCIGKMKDVAAGEGRTVLFVSHNMAAVRSLCRTGIVLGRGQVELRGTAEEAVQHYMRREVNLLADPRVVFDGAKVRGPRMVSATLRCGGQPATQLLMGDPLVIDVEFAHDTPLEPRVGLVIASADGVRIINTNNRFQPTEGMETGTRRGHVLCDLGVLPLVAGRYSISLWFGDMAHDSHIVEGAMAFEVLERDIWGLGRVPPSGDSVAWWPTRFKCEPIVD